MPFYLRNRAAILREMIAQFMALTSQITDFTDGAVARALLETVATQIGKEDYAIYSGIKEAINTSVYKTFNFSLLPPSFASGFERFYGNVLTPQTIPIGTQIQVPGTSQIYTTTAVGTLNPSSPPGSVNYVDVPIISSIVGSVGNTIADTIDALLTPLTFISSINNILPLTNGMDQETDSARFQRFQNFIAGLSRGTAYAIEAAAQGVFIPDVNGNATERVVNALVVEPWKTGGLIGNVFVYIDNGTGTASSALMALVTQVLNGYVAVGGAQIPGYVGAGVKPSYFAVIPCIASIVGAVTISPQAPSVAAVLTAVQQAIGSYVATLQVDDELVLNELIRYALDVTWTEDIDFSLPIANIVPPNGQRVTLIGGTLAITQAV